MSISDWLATKQLNSEQSHAQNFYLLKIHLNLFEISSQVSKFENLIEDQKLFISSENLFQMSQNSFQTWSPQSSAMCVYSSLSHDKVEY